MKERLTVCLAITLAIALMVPLHLAQGQEYYAYTVHIRSDGSAFWKITQFSDLNATITGWDSYQQKINGLVDMASRVTNRAMSIDDGSIEISTTMSVESKITEYSFVWLNFSIASGKELISGDVFQVEGFFSQLFGDASFELTYPEDYTPQSVNPPPYQRQDASNSLKWARTQDLADLHIVLALTQYSDGELGTLPISFIGLAIVLIAVPIGVGGFLLIKRKRRNSSNTPISEVGVPSAIESDEDRILKLLKASGGVMRQTEITEKLGFSKAKTSQLLTALESRGALARYKKGRDKIVTFKKGDI
ncbi:MarR family transcriptional regulator [Candidatus Bathyarchaeota archaeon]|nr:MarR family transcriptional regulator [Candidatus Bathyarchaeota archaeon]